jgi:hypothetical protein
MREGTHKKFPGNRDLWLFKKDFISGLVLLATFTVEDFGTEWKFPLLFSYSQLLDMEIKGQIR